MSTTNGTRVTEAARGAPAILAEAFVNAGTVADELASGAYGERVTVIGCGREGRRASEDESAAGAISNASVKGASVSTGRAGHVVGLYRTRPESLLRRNAPQRAARRLTLLGYDSNLELCVAEDSVLVVPRFKGDAFTGGKAH